MVTLVSLNKFNNTLELVGLSTDTKPVDTVMDRFLVTNGSTFYCMDDQSVYMFDFENKQWREQ